MSTKKTSQPDDLDPLVGRDCKPPTIRLEPGAQLHIYQGRATHDELAAILQEEQTSLPTDDLVYNLKCASPSTPRARNWRSRSGHALIPLEE